MGESLDGKKCERRSNSNVKILLVDRNKPLPHLLEWLIKPVKYTFFRCNFLILDQPDL